MKPVKLVLKKPAPKLAPDPTLITQPQTLLDAAESYDGASLVEELHAGAQGVDDMNRRQLIAVAHTLGKSEEDTRGKPVKAMREMVSSLLQAEEGEETEEQSQPAPAPAPKLVGKLGGVVKLPRRLS